MGEGRIEQLGSPAEVYERPATAFVAGFIGMSNLLDATAPIHDPPREGAPARSRRPGPQARTSRAEDQRSDLPRCAWHVYVVALDGGGNLVAVRQNLETAGAGTLDAPGDASTSHGDTTRPTRSRRTSPSEEDDEAAIRNRRAGGSEAARDRGASRARPVRRQQLERAPVRPAKVPDRLAPPTADLAPLTSIGKGEGSLDLIAWEGYTEPQWVKPFEKQSGCKVNAKYGARRATWCRSWRTAAAASTTWCPRRVTPTSASSRRRRQAGERRADPGVERLPPVPPEPVVQHDRRRALRRVAPVRPERAAVLDGRVPDRAHSWRSSTTSRTRAR